MSTDDAIDPRDDGPSFGRMVVDGCCHAFAGALRKVCFFLPLMYAIPAFYSLNFAVGFVLLG